MRIFGAAVEERFVAIESGQKAIQQDIAHIKETLAKTRPASEVTDQQHIETVTRLQHEVDKLKDSVAQGASAGSATVPTQPFTGIPYEQRTIARIGCLGWDDKSDVIMRRAKEVLEKANVPEADYRSLHAVRREKGSQAELIFCSHDALQKAKTAVRASNTSFVQSKFVWLDVAKDRSETRPALIIHRMADYLADVEAGMESPLPVDRQVPGKYVKVGSERAGYTLNGAWVWSRWAMTRYSEDQRNLGKGYAEDE